MLPAGYSGITPQNLPGELYPRCTTIEYTLSKKPTSPPVFLFLIDTCVPQDELDFLKDSIQMALDLLPEDAIVGLIIFGTTVQVYELGFDECTKAYVFRGDKTPTFEQVQDQLGLTQKTMMMNAPNQQMYGFQQQQQQQQMSQSQERVGASRFLLPLSECEVTLSTIIEEMLCDPWPVKPGQRSKRCTGAALSIGASLLQAAYAGSGARIMAFLGGPCTIGDGKVAGVEFSEQMRLHNDLKNDKAPYFKKAIQFYQNITQQLVHNSHTVDIFAANLDQVGVLELKSCVENTGGIMVLTDTFDNPVYKESLKSYFKRKDDYLEMAFNGSIEVQTSREIKICGCLGPVTSLNRKATNVSENEIGYGMSNAWKINGLLPSTSLAFYFEVANTQETPQMENSGRFFQFITAYQHSCGQFRLRVTTRALPWVPTGRWPEIAQGFDQETAAVLVARMSVFRAESEFLFDVLRWLDRSLIHLVSKFGDYRKGDPNSLTLAPNFAIYPQFMYHLRRSQFLRVFNSSPDETCFSRLTLNRENVTNSLIMIQPTLYSYDFDKPPHPVLLDSMSVRPNNILLLDTFFSVLIHHGETIAAWRDAGYQDKEEYANFKKLLELPREDAKNILKDRFPFPKYIECDQNSSSARFLSAKVNPSATHHTYGPGQDGFKVLTDDASLQVFTEHLRRLAVSQQ